MASTRMSGDSRPARAYQRATSRLRALPDFVIFGASKSGTTSMYDYLGAHPLVVPCRAKELHFADRPRNAANRVSPQAAGNEPTLLYRWHWQSDLSDRVPHLEHLSGLGDE